MLGYGGLAESIIFEALQAFEALLRGGRYDTGVFIELLEVICGLMESTGERDDDTLKNSGPTKNTKYTIIHHLYII